jgi:hypothetical protein
MAKTSTASIKDVLIEVPRRLAGRKLVLVEAGEYARLKKRVAELDDAIEKIRRGDRALREGKIKTVNSLLAAVIESPVKA